MQRVLDRYDPSVGRALKEAAGTPWIRHILKRQTRSESRQMGFAATRH